MVSGIQTTSAAVHEDGCPSAAAVSATKVENKEKCGQSPPIYRDNKSVCSLYMYVQSDLTHLHTSILDEKLQIKCGNWINEGQQ